MESQQQLESIFKTFQAAIAGRHVDDAEVAVQEIMELAMKECEENPSPELLVEIAAHNCELHRDWIGAEAKHRELLATAGDGVGKRRRHNALCHFLRLMGRFDEARAHSQLAVQFARESDVIPHLLAMDLRQLGDCFYDCGDIPAAKSAIDEALSLIAEDAMCILTFTDLLIMRARVEIHVGKIQAVQSDLEQAWTILEPMEPMHFAAGVQRDLSQWWSVTATLHGHQDDKEGAIAAWREAVNRARLVDAAPQCAGPHNQFDLATALHGLGTALSTADVNAEADAIFVESAAILHDLQLPRTCS